MPDTSFQELAATPSAKPKQTWPQKASGFVDELFSPVSKPIGAIAGGLGGAAARMLAPKQEQAWTVGATTAGEQLPRTAAEAFLTSKGLPGKALGLGDVAMRTFAETPTTEPLSARLGATALQTGAFMAAPKVGEMAGSMTKALMPTTLNPLLRTAAARGASLIGTLGGFEAANAASAKVQGQEYNPLTAEHLAGVAASVLPFEAAGMYQDVKPHLVDLAARLAGKNEAQRVINTHQQLAPVAMRREEAYPQGMDKEQSIIEANCAWIAPDNSVIKVDVSHPRTAIDILQSKFGLTHDQDTSEEALYQKGYLRRNEDSTAIMISGRGASETQLRELKNQAIEKNKVLQIECLGADGVYRPKVFFTPSRVQKMSQPPVAMSQNKPPTENLLPTWAREEMIRRGLAPGRTFNDVDLQNSSVREAIQLDPSLTDIQKKAVLEKGALPSVPQKMSQPLRDHFTNLEELGHKVGDNSMDYERISKLDRLPDESPFDWAARKAGIDPKVFAKAAPDEMFKSVKALSETYAKDSLGLPDDQAQAFAKSILKFANLSGSELGETRVVPAILEDDKSAAAFFSPASSRYNAAAIIALLDPTYKPGITTQGAMLDFMHQLGHEYFHNWMDKIASSATSGLNEKTLTHITNLFTATNDAKWTTVDMEKAVQSIATSMTGKGFAQSLQYRSKYYTPDVSGRTEALADIYGLLSIGAMKGKVNGKELGVISDLLKFSSDDFRNVARPMFRDIGTMVSHFIDIAKRLLGWKPSSIRSLQDIVDNMKGLQKSAEWADHATEAFLLHNEIRNATPLAPIAPVSYDRVEKLFSLLHGERYDPGLKNMAQDVSENVVPQKIDRTKKTLPIHLNWLHNMIPQVQLGRIVLQLADMAKLGFLRTGLMKTAVWDFMEEFRSGLLDKYGEKAVQSSITPGEVNTAVSDVQRAQNEIEGTDAGRAFTPEEREKVPSFAALKPEDKVKAAEFLTKYSSAGMKAAARQVLSSKHVAGITTGYSVQEAMRHAGMDITWDKAEALGRAIVEQHFDSDILAQSPEHPVYSKQAEEALRVLTEFVKEDPRNAAIIAKVAEIYTTDDEGMPIEAGKTSRPVMNYRAFREHMQGKWIKDEEHPDGYLQGKPGWSSEGRAGRFLIYSKMKGEGEEVAKPRMVGYNTMKAAKKAYQEMMDAYNKDKDLPEKEQKWEVLKLIDKENDIRAYQGLRPDSFRLHNELMSSLITRIASQMRAEFPGSEDVINEMQKELQPSAETAELMKAPWMKERELVGGRETVNMPDAQLRYYNAVAHSIAKKEIRAQQRLYLNDPKMRGQAELQTTARKYFDTLENMHDSSYGNLKGLVFMNYCMFSPSLAFVELSQQLTNHAQELIQLSGDVSGSYKGLAQANKDYFKSVWEGHKSGLGYNKYDREDETNFIQWMDKNGFLGGGTLQEYAHASDDVSYINARSSMVGDNNILDRQGLLGKPLYHIQQFGMKAHDMAIRLNTEVAAISSRRMLEKLHPDWTEQQLNDEANTISHYSMHGGGSANRPLFFLGIKGGLSPQVGGLMYILQMYVYNTIAQHAILAKNAIAGAGLSATEKLAAQKAAGVSLATMATFAGISGIPLATQLFALIEQFFPQSEPKRKMREMFYGTGEWLNSKTHLYAQDKQMGSFVADAAMDGLINSVPGGVNMSSRFELGGLMGVSPYGGFDWANMLGPSKDMLSRLMVKAPQAAAAGDFWGAARDLIPNNQIRRIAQLATDGWNVRNADQRLNVKLTDAEKVMQAAGFTPKSITDQRALGEAQKRAEKIESAEQKQFHEQMATLVLQGKTGEVTSALYNRAKTVHMYDPKEGARRIAELVQQRTTPFDPTRTGTRVGQTYNVAKSYTHPPQSSETQRLLERFGLTQKLGFPQRLSKTEMLEAQMLDQVMSMYPTMTRVEAKEMIDKQFHAATLAQHGVQF